MQGTVSIIIPCYNKQAYIGHTLESVMAQQWDSIQLILVNDGSTDDTRKVITQYVPKIQARGYEVIVVDQPNAGCCAAVKTGLSWATGEYVSLIDADDELDPAYVSTMAGWLEEHTSYDYCSCGYASVWYAEGQKPRTTYTPYLWPQATYTPDFFLSQRFCKAAWAFLCRMAYIRKCGLTEDFYVDTRGSYEPSFVLPLALYGGTMKHFDTALYYYHVTGSGLSQQEEFEKNCDYWREYHRVVLLILNRTPDDILDPYKRKYLAALSACFTRMLIFLFSVKPNVDKNITERQGHDLLAYLNNWLSLDPFITYEEARQYPAYLFDAAEMALSGTWAEQAPPGSRIIGYGVLGQAAAQVLPLLNGSIWQPTALWDAAGDGVKVKQPDFDSLSAEDTVLLFPAKPEVVNDVLHKLAGRGVRVIGHRDIRAIVARLLFPQLGRE